MGLFKYSLIFSVCFSYFLTVCWRSCFEAACEVGFKNDLPFLKEARMNGLCAALRALKVSHHAKLRII